MTSEAAWDISAIIAVGVVVAAIVVRHFKRIFSKSGTASCGGNCCGAGGKKPPGDCK
ncbi:conserved hypothetical protein [Rhodospirillaceae bacterium LM-1]|jgi:hypothetical protein|nr:conserved hypothetical protein [Rhodospirillaceae bacterium LM-1]